MPRQININHLRINDERIKSYVDTETAKAGKHEIIDDAGTALPSEPNIRFNGLNARDGATVSTTEIEAKGLNVDDLAEIVSTAPANYAVGNTAMYSTTEQVVGRWIDGKPLYQRTIQITLPSNLTNNVSYIVLYEAVGHEFISGEGYVEYNDGSVIGRVSIGYGSFVVSSETDATRFLWNGDKTYLAIRGSHFKGRPAIATIKYTKTGD